jgi:hypothetical protein
MFAVIYQAYIKEGRESEYREAWNVVARYFVEKRGAIGSCLHKTPEGVWVAYSRWPNKMMRDASWPGEKGPSDELPFDIQRAVLSIKDCLERKLPEICMEVVDDLLLLKSEI